MPRTRASKNRDEDAYLRMATLEDDMKSLKEMMQALLLNKESRDGGEQTSSQTSNREFQDSENVNLPTNEHNASVRLSNSTASPEKLVETVTYAQFKDWRYKYENFIAVQSLEFIPEKQGLALLQSFFSQDTSDVVRLILKFDGLPKNTTNVLNKLEDYFKKKENGRLRRSQFMSRRQEQGESFMSFYREKLKLFQLTDPCSSCYSRCLVDHIIESLFDANLRTKCRTLPETAGIEDVIKLCETEEAALNEENVLNNSVSKIKIQPGGNKKCLRCGNLWHLSLKDCPASKVVCDRCNRRGHFTNFCRKKNLQRIDGAYEDERSESLRMTSVTAYSENQKRQIDVKVKSLMQPAHTIMYKATPDTGAEVCAAGEDFIRCLNHKKEELHESKISLESADQSKLKNLGFVDCEIVLNERCCKAKIYICSGIKELLIDRATMMKLGIIHEEFPKQIFNIKLDRVPENPSNEFCIEMRNKLLQDYKDVFNSGQCLQPMDGRPMHIFLRENVVPHAITCPRRIPFAWRDKVKEELDNLVSQQIIKPVHDTPADFVSPLVIVQKKNSKLRLTVDYTKLNAFVKRPVHPFKYPWEAVSNINGNPKYFSTLDTTSGYWQLLLDEESQKLTTFLTPWGRYMFLRAPMGLVSSGDEFCRRSDEAIRDFKNIEKVVDDVLLYDETFPEHVKRIVSFLERCRTKRISLNPQKFIFAQAEVEYVGYVVGRDGLKADPHKVEAIQRFPKPTCLKDLRSFMGLVNQLGNFSNEISETASPLRDLLKTRNHFQWNATHDQAFSKVREVLSKPPILTQFDPTLETALHADASRLNGLGFALLQRERSGVWKLIQCGSRFLSDAETRYSMIELELLSIVWAVRKCRLYLLGLNNFKIISDHKPLLPILNSYTLDMVENPRLQRLKEKLSGYNFLAEWTKGLDHLIPDALSRAPVGAPKDEELMGEEANTHVESFIIQRVSLIDNSDESTRTSHLQDSMLLGLKKDAEKDESYQMLIKSIKDGFPQKKNDANPLIKPYWNIKDELSVDDGLVLKGCQIVIPVTARKTVLERLHDSHQGIERTRCRARQTVYWPNINNDIKNIIESCESCQSIRPSLQKETYMCDPLPMLPFQDVSADLFSCSGRKYMVYVDRLSGWPIVCHYGARDPTSSMVISDLRKIFADTGIPLRFRSDNGPQFSSFEFNSFLKKWNVIYCPSSPYYPQSNGHAESGVKGMKHLILKCMVGGKLDEQKFLSGLLEWRNTPKKDGRSPAQVLFGHDIRSMVPIHHRAFSSQWQRVAHSLDRKARDHSQKVINYNQHAKDLGPIPAGTKVRMQCKQTKLWDRIGEVVEVGQNRRYTIKTASGRILIRNRRFIKVI